MKKKIISTILLLLTAIIWGFAFVAQVKGMESVGTFTFNGIRFFIGALAILPLALISCRKGKTAEADKTEKNKFKSSICFGLAAGALLFTAATLQQYGIEFEPDGNSMKAGFITGLYTILVPVSGFLLFRKKTGAATWVGAVGAAAGLYLLCVEEGVGFGASDILLFISVPAWTAHIMLIDRVGEKINPYIFSVTQYFFCGIASMAGALIFDRGSLNFSSIGGAMLPILYGGIMSVGVAYTLQIIGQRHADPTVAAIVLSCESMFGAIGNMLLLSVNLDVRQYIGCLLIFAGIIISQLRFGKKKKPTEDVSGSD